MNAVTKISFTIFFVVHFIISSAQSIVWQNTLGGNDIDWFWSMDPTLDGGFICGGYSNSNISGDKSEDSKGYDDYWIVKIDSVGSIEWQKTIGGDSYDRLTTIQTTTDNGFICGGW